MGGDLKPGPDVDPASDTERRQCPSAEAHDIHVWWLDGDPSASFVCTGLVPAAEPVPATAIERLAVLGVPPGSLIVLKASHGDPEADQAIISAFVVEISERFGHTEFVVLHLHDDAEIEVWDAGGDVMDRVTTYIEANGGGVVDDEPEPDEKPDPPAPIVGVPGPPAPLQLPQVDDKLEGKKVIR